MFGRKAKNLGVSHPSTQGANEVCGMYMTSTCAGLSDSFSLTFSKYVDEIDRLRLITTAWPIARMKMCTTLLF